MKDIMDIKDKYKGRSAFIAGCGVSLNDYTEEQIKEEIKDDVVLCIKQAQYRFKDECDFHFINDNNISKYIHAPKTEIVAGCRLDLNPWCTNEVSYRIVEVFKGPHMINECIAAIKDFSINEIRSNNQFNLLGPGIMYGVVIPFAVHCGFSHLKFLGWDYAINKDENLLTHFYDHSVRSSFDRTAPQLMGDEYQMVIDSTDELYKYLSSKGITSEILTDKSVMSDLFPRRILK
jgi:hypothetical protein